MLHEESTEYTLIIAIHTMTQPITVRIQIASTLQEVWEKWTQAQHVIHWNFASPDWHCPDAENDLKVGGKFTYTMASRDGQMSFPFGGVYTAVEPMTHIAYVMEDGRRVAVDFQEKGGITEVVEVFDPETINSLELQQQGWQAILDNFKAYAER